MKSTKIASGLVWKLLERFGVQGGQFILQIVLARLLAPEYYGTLSLMIIFINLANVFIQTGFSAALVQNKDVTKEDYSSVFWVSLLIAGVLYLLIFISSPFIAKFYNMPEIVEPLRCLAVMLFPGAMNSVQLAKVNREMDFKKVFVSNLGAIIVSGTVGIILAFVGAGLWALVAQNIVNITMAAIVMFFVIDWKPQLVCDFYRVKVLFTYGWKLLVSNLLDTLYQELRSLIIGRKYDSGTLAYYNRGKQFPQFIISAINTSVQNVMLSAMSAEQENKTQVKLMLRNAMMMSAYIIFPMMAGLAGIASPLVEFILTEKWLPCVPYMQIYCFTLAFYPINSCNLQAINALGRSDVFLKLEIIKKVYGTIILVIAVVAFDSPLAIAGTGVITTWLGWFVNASPNKKLVGYSYVEQVKDISPSFFISVIMFLVVSGMGRLPLGTLSMLMVQIVSGISVYLILSIACRIRPYAMLKDIIKNR